MPAVPLTPPHPLTRPPCAPGHLPAILSSKAPLILADWAAGAGPVMRLRVAADPLLVVTDPAEAGRLLRRGPGYLPKAPKLYRALEVGGWGLGGWGAGRGWRLGACAQLGVVVWAAAAQPGAEWSHRAAACRTRLARSASSRRRPAC
jgi:hypothetical protein